MIDIFKNEKTLKLKKRLDEINEKSQVIHQSMDIIWSKIEHRGRHDQVSFKSV